MKADLAAPAPSDASPLEALPIDRVAACWLQVHAADVLAAKAAPAGTPTVLREFAFRQEAAQRRYLAAVKQLALVRRLLRPNSKPKTSGPVGPAPRNGASCHDDGR
jgi:hypothetical protein